MVEIYRPQLVHKEIREVKHQTSLKFRFNLNYLYKSGKEDTVRGQQKICHHYIIHLY